MINIAIDGPSSAGKSTIAKILANKLGYIHLDTGAMYRCCALVAKQTGIDYNDDNDLNEMLNTIKIDFDGTRVFLNGEEVTSAIRTNDISMLSSKISAKPIVRSKMVYLQRDVTKKKGFIVDGRDIGTIVLPDAEVKIYMVASVECRAKRRYKEYLEKQIDANYEEIFKTIEERDYQDTHRETSPLCKADDAIELDTSNMNIEEVVSSIESLIAQKVRKEDL